MIKRDIVDKILETARVEEVIGDFVNLKRAGSNLKGFSPFNDEKSPSFMVSPSKQIWKDFSSGKGGGAVAFLMEHERMTYPEALRWLAKRYNIEIEETEETNEEKQRRSERESMFIVLDFAKKWYRQQLLETEIGKSVGGSYFKERGFRKETLDTYETGFAPEQKDAFTQAAIKKGYKKEFLIKTGLTLDKSEHLIDRFRGRVMFPIHSLSGRVLGFGGRILNTQLKTAKYINSPESEVYHKGKVLYGIYQAKQEIVKQDQCILVEGYTDVMAFHQAGIKNVVASSGTALTKEQIQLIKRLTKNILVIFDGDPAGIRAAIRGIDMILEAGLNVRVLLLPEGEDPDSFSKSISSDELSLYLAENMQDFIKFKADLLQKEANNDPIKRSELVRNIIESIAKIPSEIQREIYIKEVAKLMSISENVLFTELARVQQSTQRRIEKDYLRKKQKESLKPVVKTTTERDVIDRRSILEKNIIKYLLLYGTKEIEVEDWEFEFVKDEKGKEDVIIEKFKRKLTVAEEIYLQMQADEMGFANPSFKQIYDLIINRLLNDEEIEIPKLLLELDEEGTKLISDILFEQDKYKLDSWEEHDIEVKTSDETLDWSVPDVALNLRRYLTQELINKKKEALKEELPEDKIQDLLLEIKNYLNVYKAFSMRLRRLSR